MSNWGIYKPLSWQTGAEYAFKLDRCRHHVYSDIPAGFHQCLRKPKVTLRGYRFCLQHAKIFRERNGLK